MAASGTYKSVSCAQKAKLLREAGEDWPVCECHGAPKRWNSRTRNLSGGEWACGVKLSDKERSDNRRRHELRKLKLDSLQLRNQAAENGWVVPKRATLQKYGLSVKSWIEIVERQGWVCAVCGKPPKGTMSTDHYHARGWSKMPSTSRAKYVRGIIHLHCNWRIVGTLTLKEARMVVQYLEAYEAHNDSHSGR